MQIQTKRIYEEAAETDGYRVLVDRLWPRGISRPDAAIDEWLKDVAPSAELRKWFNHEADKFDTFESRYREELTEHHDTLAKLLNRVSEQRLTLLYAARNQDHNHAVVLRKVLEDMLES